MKKILLLLLVFPFVFTSCSDDDDKDTNNGNIDTFSAEVGLDNYDKETFIFTWSKIQDAYRYVVFFKAEGGTEWQESNSKMASESDGSLITSAVMAGFVEGVSYDMYIVAYRDSQSNSEIAKSKTIKGVILEIDGNDYVDENSVIGTWIFSSVAADVVSSNPEVTKEIKENLTDDYGVRKFILKADNTYEYFENDDNEELSLNEVGTYSTEKSSIYFEYDDDGKPGKYSYLYGFKGSMLVLGEDYLEHIKEYPQQYYDTEKYPNVEVVKAIAIEYFVKEK